MEKFSSFSYLVRNDFIYKDKVEVRVFFIYLDQGVVNKSLFLNKVNNKPERLYIADAKKIISKMIANGALEKHAKETLKKQKKKRTLSIALSIVALVAVAGGAVGGYMAYLNNIPSAPLSPWYEYSDWWNYCSNGNPTSEATVEDIGKEVNLMVNNQVHKVRLIDVDKDKDGNGKTIHTTFEFINLISDENGYSLATYWKNINDHSGGYISNHDYKNSSVRKALTNNGNGDLHWFEKDSKYFSTTYADKSVLDMLPKGLADVLVAPSKYINIYNSEKSKWEEQTVEDKLFLLSPFETGNRKEHEEYEEPSTFCYSYYKGTEDDNKVRIKYQVKWHDGARTDDLYVYDGEYDSNKYSRAGCNSEAKNEGGEAWLRSPDTEYNNSPYYYAESGGVYSASIAYYYAQGVAPAFCI